MGRNSNYNNPNWRPDTTDVWSFQETLHERNGRAVAAGETWQVGSDIVEVLGKAEHGWAVRSLYTRREYEALDNEFIYWQSDAHIESY